MVRLLLLTVLTSFVPFASASAGVWDAYNSCAGAFCTAEYLAMGTLPKINAAGAYELGFTGRGVTVAVVDSGARLTHNEFAGKVSPLENALLTQDVDAHATHTSGTVLAAKNGAGMHGVAYDAELLSIAIHLDGNAVRLEAADAFNELAEDRYDHIKIINNSWGFGIPFQGFEAGFPSYERLPMKRLAAKDKLMVFSAGNNARLSLNYPAAYASVDGFLKFNVLSVVAYDGRTTPADFGFLARYSNTAKGAEAYTVAAPGGDSLGYDASRGVYSALSGSDTAYGFMNGTSMAAPHVSGVAALVQSAFPYMGGKQIADVILSTADKDLSNVSPAYHHYSWVTNGGSRVHDWSIIFVKEKMDEIRSGFEAQDKATLVSGRISDYRSELEATATLNSLCDKVATQYVNELAAKTKGQLVAYLNENGYSGLARDFSTGKIERFDVLQKVGGDYWNDLKRTETEESLVALLVGQYADALNAKTKDDLVAELVEEEKAAIVERIKQSDKDVVSATDELSFAEIFGQGFVDAAAAVRGPKYLDASRLRERAYSDGEGFSAPSDYDTGLGQFFYTVDTQGFDSVWSHDISEKPSTASGYEAAHIGLKKQGAGRLVLSGNNTFGGLSVVEGGVLEFSGTFAAGVNVTGGELFLNNGTVSAGVTSASVVSFAGSPSVASLTVSGGTVDVGTARVSAGAFVFDSSPATLAFTVGADGNGRLTGAAPEFTVSPLLKIDVDRRANLSVGDTFSFFDASAAGDVTSDGLSNRLYAFERTGKGEYSLSRVYKVSELAAANGASGEIARLAESITGGTFANTNMNAVADRLYQAALDRPEELAKLTRSVRPDENASVKKAAAASAKSLFSAVSNRVSSVSGRSGGDSITQAGLWLKYLYNHTSADESFKGRSKGVILGGDAAFDNGLLLGAAYAQTETDITPATDDRKAKNYTRGLTGYGRYRNGKAAYDLSLSYAFNHVKEEKTLSSDNYSSNQFSVQALAGYDFSLATPKGGLRYTGIFERAHTDALGQRVSGSNAELLTGVAGLAFSHRAGRFDLSAEALLTYDFVSDYDTIQVVLPNGAGYAVSSKRLERAGAELSAQAVFRLDKTVSFSAEYAGAFKKDFDSHTGMFRLRFSF